MCVSTKKGTEESKLKSQDQPRGQSESVCNYIQSLSYLGLFVEGAAHVISFVSMPTCVLAQQSSGTRPCTPPLPLETCNFPQVIVQCIDDELIRTSV